MKVTKITNEVKTPTIGKEHIPSSNCCGSCMYNIPQGTLLLLLPGVTLLFIGIVVTILDRNSPWQEGILNVGIIFVCIGFVMTSVVVGFCITTWRKRKPKSAGPQSSKKARRAANDTTDNGVTLVGIYRISSPDTDTIASPDSVIYSVPQDVVIIPHTAIT